MPKYAPYAPRFLSAAIATSCAWATTNDSESSTSTPEQQVAMAFIGYAPQCALSLTTAPQKTLKFGRSRGDIDGFPHKTYKPHRAYMKSADGKRKGRN